MVLVLSDWTDDSPGYVMQTLKRGSEWYSRQKGAAQSIAGAARLGMMSDYFSRELRRMPPMDISDVAYDRFLINGKPMQKVAARPGESFRLRVINGATSSFFYVEFADGPMTIISADGQGVEPVKIKRLLMGIAETYDLLIKIPDRGSYEFRATAQDGSSWASLWLGSGPAHPAPNIPRPNLYYTPGALTVAKLLALTPAGSVGMPDSEVAAGKFDRPGIAGMGDKGHGDMKGMADAASHDGEMKMSGQTKKTGKGRRSRGPVSAARREALVLRLHTHGRRRGLLAFPGPGRRVRAPLGAVPQA